MSLVYSWRGLGERVGAISRLLGSFAILRMWEWLTAWTMRAMSLSGNSNMKKSWNPQEITAPRVAKLTNPYADDQG